MNQYIMFPHGGSKNHGCEAIVRTTKTMLENDKVILFSDNVEDDVKYLSDIDIDICNPKKKLKRGSIEHIWATLRNRVLKVREAFDLAAYKPVISKCNKSTTLISIGGDNYCYGDNEYIYMVNRYARRHGTRTILWGCSVEESGITDRMREDLKGYDLIVARESITKETLKKINENVFLRPDPAFTLPVGQGRLPENIGKHPFVGVNISPTVERREKIPEITYRNYVTLIRNILSETDMDVLLIPHVIWDVSDDRIPLQKLYSEFKSTNRVFLIEDQNCLQLKDIISRCEIFVGARTHATIAAYSTCVPTLVVGYSVKAQGIAKDLFGTDKDYVIPVQELGNESVLWSAFMRVYQQRDEIRNHLQKCMPDYIERAMTAGDLLKERY